MINAYAQTKPLTNQLIFALTVNRNHVELKMSSDVSLNVRYSQIVNCIEKWEEILLEN